MHYLNDYFSFTDKILEELINKKIYYSGGIIYFKNLKYSSYFNI